VVYTALQGKFDAGHPYRNGKGQRFVIHQALFVSMTVQIIEFQRVLKLFCEIRGYLVRNLKLEELEAPHNYIQENIMILC
jgi:hypothetical protein